MFHRLTIFAAIAALVSVQSAHAVDPAVKCEASKLKEAAKYASCRLKAEAKGVQKSEAADYTKCEEKFTEKFNNAETKAGVGVCPSEGDEASINARVTDDADTVALLLSGTRYVDNSDGTVTDIETGLTWQKTDDAGGVTDKDNQYTWNPAYPGTAPTGTAFTVFLAGLNGADDGTCFANHCDWRIPTIEELQTILLEPFPCGTNPCINQAVFGPQNASSGYWSSTTVADDPTAAKDVPFDYGDVVNDAKDYPVYVRAVRGGS